MKAEDKFEKIWIDLRPFGWGIREVSVIWPEGHEGGEITPGVPIPHDTVDGASIIDGSVQEEDLNDAIKDRMTITHDSASGGLRIGGYARPGNIPTNGTQDTGQGGGEDEDLEDDQDNGGSGEFSDPVDIEEGD